MARKILSCATCQRKYVIRNAGSQVCLDCAAKNGTNHGQETTEGANYSANNENNMCNNKTNSKHRPRHGCVAVESVAKRQKNGFSASESPNQKDGYDDAGGVDGVSSDGDSLVSEGGDDLHCTQIADAVDDDSSEEIPLDVWINRMSSKSQAPTNEKMQPIGHDFPLSTRSDTHHPTYDDTALEAISDHLQFETKNLSDNDIMVCSVCGKSLAHIKSGFKGRLKHLKRCSAKHSVSARDVRLNDELEIFQNVEESSLHKSRNPYLQATQDWHGNASLGLRVTKNSAPDTVHEKTSNLPTKRSIHSVLMAGAFRKAKIDKIKAADVQSKSSYISRGNHGGRGKRRVGYLNKKCPAYKKIPGTDFIVDGFFYTEVVNTKNFFLTHFHADHYGGLSKHFNAGTIYCSLPTANLVHQQLGVSRKFLHPLPMMTPMAIESQGQPITVTVIDANHCPGAVMFLFEVGKRRILHVGDFRWNTSIMSQYIPLKPFFSGEYQLDDLFLDTTYCDTKYCLPQQCIAIEAAVQKARVEVERAKQQNRQILILFGAYTIGKERIYLSVAESLGLKLYVDQRRFRILSRLEWPKDRLNILTTQPHETFLWVVPLGHVNLKRIISYKSIDVSGFRKSFDAVIGFRPTGWSMSTNRSDIISTRSRGDCTIHSVPYSEHSSFSELLDCLQCLRPRRIIPTVAVSKSQQQVDLLLNELEKRSKATK